MYQAPAPAISCVTICFADHYRIGRLNAQTLHHSKALKASPLVPASCDGSAISEIQVAIATCHKNEHLQNSINGWWRSLDLQTHQCTLNDQNCSKPSNNTWKKNASIEDERCFSLVAESCLLIDPLWFHVHSLEANKNLEEKCITVRIIRESRAHSVIGMLYIKR